MDVSMNNPLPYYVLFLVNISFLPVCIHLKNPFLHLWFFFGLIPLFDQIFNYDIKNPTREEQKKMKHMLRFKIPIVLTVIMDWILLIWSINEIIKNKNGNFYNFGIIIFMILVQGTSFTTSHELNHKPSLFEKFLGTFCLSKSFYMHFLIEHNQGHHRNVATLEDPATSRYDESIYQFFPRSIINSYLSAWKIENGFCKEKYKTSFTWKNRMIYFTLCVFLVPIIFYYIFGLVGMIMEIIIGVGSILLLETINYIEHYGLKRKKLPDGTNENVNITHSWNAPHRVSNYFLFKLQRHSDHHENALKPYQNLCTYDKSPQLPNGYALCFLLALYPSKWFEIMNPIVNSYKNGETISKELKKEINGKLYRFIFGINFLWFIMMSVQYTFTL